MAAYSSTITKINNAKVNVPTPNCAILTMKTVEMKAILGEIGFGLREDVELKTRDGKKATTGMNGQFIEPDGMTLASLGEYDSELYNCCQHYRGVTASASGVFNRMKKAYSEYKQVRFTPEDIEEALDIFTFTVTDDVKKKVNDIFDADHVTKMPFPDMDMSTSSGLYYQATAAGTSQAANVCVPKSDIPLDDMLEDAQQILDALTTGRLGQLINEKPALFTLILKSKEEVADVRTVAQKSRPYYSISYALNFLASIVFQPLQESITGFWEDNPQKDTVPSASAYKISYMFMEEFGKNGSEMILDFIEATKVDNARSMGYGDDSFFVWSDGKDLFYSGPDVSHLDMSLGPHFKNLLMAYMEMFYVDYCGIPKDVYNKSWVKLFLRFYFDFCFKSMVLGPQGILFVKDKGYSSGLPGTTLIDMFCMAPFHVNVRKELNKLLQLSKKTIPLGSYKDCFTKAANKCGFTLKDETLIVKKYDKKKKVTEIPFLGATINDFHYDRGPTQFSVKVPYYDPEKLARSMVYNACIVKKEQKAPLQVARLLGLALNTFNHKTLFTALDHAMKLLKESIIRNTPNVLIPDVNKYSIDTVQLNHYLKLYVGKPIQQVEVPTVLRIISYFTNIELPDDVKLPISSGETQQIRNNLKTNYINLYEDYTEQEGDSFENLVAKEEEEPEEIQQNIVNTVVKTLPQVSNEVKTPPNIQNIPKKVEQLNSSSDDTGVDIAELNERYSDFSKILEFISLKNKFKDEKLTSYVTKLVQLAKVEFAILNPPLDGLDEDDLDYYKQGLSAINPLIVKIKDQLILLINQRIKELSKRPEVDSFLTYVTQQLKTISENIPWGDTFINQPGGSIRTPETVPSNVPNNKNNNQRTTPVRAYRKVSAPPVKPRRGAYTSRPPGAKT